MSERKSTNKRCKHDYTKIKVTTYSTPRVFMDGTCYIEDYCLCSKCGRQKTEKKWVSRLEEV